MKKLIATLSLCCILSVAYIAPMTSFAQSSSKTATADKEGTVKMKNGKAMVMSNGSWAALTSTKTLSDGSTVSADGTVMGKNGTKTTLKEGDCVKPDGTIKRK